MLLLRPDNLRRGLEVLASGIGDAVTAVRFAAAATRGYGLAAASAVAGGALAAAVSQVGASSTFTLSMLEPAFASKAELVPRLP